MALIEWKELIEKLDKRPLSVLLALTIGWGTWTTVNWRDEVADHKRDLRESNKVLKEANELQYKIFELIQNNQKWRPSDTIVR